jgi:sialate O-acetylesterase
MQKIFIFICMVFICDNLFAQLKLASIFTNNMVLQQKKANKIWGTAKANTIVNIEYNKNKTSTIANKNGEWIVSLKPLEVDKLNKAFSISISAENEKIEIKNILVGEVWLCSGQSNMEFTMSNFKDVYANEFKNAKNDNIRFAVIEKKYDNKENKNARLSKAWSSIDTSTIGDCSAVAYFYAKKLYQRLKVPIGLVNVAWSGTPAQAWVDTKTLQSFSTYDSFYTKYIAPIDFTTLESLRRVKQEKYTQLVKKALLDFKEIIKIDFDDSQWEKTTLPKNWEENGHPNVDGIGAYRIEITLPRNIENKKAVLHLPAIDDEDSTYINDKFIGTKYSWNEKRVYDVEANILHEGKNIITIWVNDTGGGGGLADATDDFYIQIGEEKISLKGNAKFKILVERESLIPNINEADLQNQPSVLFNGMIAPLLNYSFKGVIWYQGESNATKYEEYKKLFPSLIKNWRSRFMQNDFPFLFVQLSSYNPNKTEPTISDWAYLRESQTETLKLPQTAMAVTYDVGDQWDIHPKKKKEVGERLAAGAFKIVYGFKNEVASGPTVSTITFPYNTIAIVFNNIGGGLRQHGEKLLGFEVAGADKKFKVATSAIIRDNIVVVGNSEIPKPLYVRYAWANAPMDANLFNAEGFPALPFRLDK